MSGLEVAPLATMLFAGSTALSAGSQIMAGNEKSAAAQFEAQQYAQQRGDLPS